MFTELAWHSLFIRTLLIRPARSELAHYVPDFTILCLPSFKADPQRHGVRSETVIAVNFTKRMILIGGSYYAGEMKKSVFTTLNYYLPAESVMPMHCSANVGKDGDVALFFGLSGTGKTTLSADPHRTLIGDDEHGWGPQGVFNFEGGCYAKCIKLSQEAEPEIYAATLRFGTILENVVFDPDTRICDFDDDSRTENTRSAYPLDYIPNASRTGRAGMPKKHRAVDGRRFRGDAADRQAHPRTGDVPFPVRATPRRWRAPKRVWLASSRNFQPASVPRSCRATLRSMATCCANSSARTASIVGSLTPAGPAAVTASAAACRSR